MQKKNDIILQNYYFCTFRNKYCSILETYINLPSMDFLVKISKSATSQPILSMLSIIILLF